MNDWQLSNQEKSALFWYLENSNELGVRFSFNDSLASDFGLNIYMCNMDALGQDGIGFGFDLNPKLAQLKSCMEAMERYLSVRLKWTHSSGCSLHPELIKAEKKAAYEALERDAFFCHFLTQTPFCSIADAQHEIKWNRELAKMGCSGRLFRLRSHKDIYVITAVIHNPALNIGICLGYGADTNFEEALNHAKLESLSFYSWLKSEKAPRDYNLNQFMLTERVNIFDHGHLGFDQEYVQWFKDTFFEKPIEYSDSTGQWPIVELIQHAETPFYLCRAKHELLQEPYWGRYHIGHMKRLSEFCGKDFSHLNYPPFPHCFA